jgi:hypothetical protein
VQCTLALLIAGEAGHFGDFSSEQGGQYVYSDNYVANGDDTTVGWSSDVQDFDHEVSAVVHRNAPSATALDDCAAEASTEDQWECIESLVRSATLIETCTEPVFWTNF